MGRFHGEEANDDVRQACRTEHERGRDAEDIEGGLVRLRVFPETEIGNDLIKLREHRDVFTAHIGNEAELRDRIAGDDHGHEDRRHRVRKDQHAVLRNLRVGDALHATQDSVEEDDHHADHDAPLEGNTEEARERDADPLHLAGDVGERNRERTYHRNHAR